MKPFDPYSLVHEAGRYYVLRSPVRPGWLELCKLSDSWTHGVVVGHFGPGHHAKAIAACEERAALDNPNDGVYT